MGLIDRLENIFSEKEENVETTMEDADKTFQRRKSKQIKEARKNSDQFVSETDEVIGELDESLEELTEYEDAADIQAVEDVADNFYNSRKNLIENFKASDEIEDHFEDLDDFVEELNDVSRKEGAVMKRVKNSSGVLSEKFSNVIQHRDDMSDFLDSDYQVIKQLEQIQEALSEIEGLSEETEEVEKKINSSEESIDKIEEDLNEKRSKVSDLEDTDDWSQKENLEDSINYLESRRDDLEKSISRRASNLDRGLKKLIYSVEKSGTEFNGDVDVLKNIRSKNFESLENPAVELEKASEKILQEDLLGERQMEKFEDAVEKFQDFDGNRNEIKEYENEIEGKKNELKELEITDKRESLIRDIEKMERKLEEKKDNLHESEEELQNLKDDRLEELRTLEIFMEKTLGVEVSLHPWFEKKEEA